MQWNCAVCNKDVGWIYDDQLGIIPESLYWVAGMKIVFCSCEHSNEWHINMELKK